MVKNNKGITLVALIVTIIVLLIITTAGISTTLDRFELNDYKKMKSDLEFLEDKVSDYYLKYEGLPILRQGSSLASASQTPAGKGSDTSSNIEKETSKPIEFMYIEYLNKLTNTNQEPATNANDNDIYYIIDLEALGNITLNYGKDYKENLDKDDFYIINEQSHTIYYVKGVEMDGVTYHYIKKDEQISDDVPPTAPEINVISGTQSKGIYINKVMLEIIPGKEKITNVRETSCIVTKDGSELIKENINDTKQIELNDSGKYKIAAYTTDGDGNSSDKTVCELEINIIYYRNKNLENAQGYLLSNSENIEVWDLFDNKLIIPAGFKITYDSKNVTEGTVIEDDAGNQFVWIPISETDSETHKIKNETKSETITLGRYEFMNNGANSEFANSDYKEDGLTSYGNGIAKNINDFIDRANKNGGFYIGRYEARVEDGGNPDKSDMKSNFEAPNSNWTAYKANTAKLVLKPNTQVWNYVTQYKASELCKNMYNNSNMESDLINSYAWDTAIVFFQKFGEISNYSYQTSLNKNNVIANTGTSGNSYTGKKDIICNVYDMASNCLEWTTETYLKSNPCVRRGGVYKSAYSDFHTATRDTNTLVVCNDFGTFRPILYT